MVQPTMIALIQQTSTLIDERRLGRPSIGVQQDSADSSEESREVELPLYSRHRLQAPFTTIVPAYLRDELVEFRATDSHEAEEEEEEEEFADQM